MASGTALANLEDFTILRDGQPVTAPDVNFWGVTFAADSNRFFATLATGGHTYLVEGDLAARRVVVGRDNVECPSLSPDGTRIGFKKRMDDGSGSPVWRFHVLDLRTGRRPRSPRHAASTTSSSGSTTARCCTAARTPRTRCSRYRPTARVSPTASSTRPSRPPCCTHPFPRRPSPASPTAPG